MKIIKLETLCLHEPERQWITSRYRTVLLLEACQIQGPLQWAILADKPTIEGHYAVQVQR